MLFLRHRRGNSRKLSARPFAEVFERRVKVVGHVDQAPGAPELALMYGMSDWNELNGLTFGSRNVDRLAFHGVGDKLVKLLLRIIG